jgi:hypothetical protein
MVTLRRKRSAWSDVGTSVCPAVSIRSRRRPLLRDIARLRHRANAVEAGGRPGIRASPPSKRLDTDPATYPALDSPGGRCARSHDCGGSGDRLDSVAGAPRDDDRRAVLNRGLRGLDGAPLFPPCPRVTFPNSRGVSIAWHRTTRTSPSTNIHNRPFIDISTPVELLSTMITPENPAVLIRDFKTTRRRLQDRRSVRSVDGEMHRVAAVVLDHRHVTQPHVARGDQLISLVRRSRSLRMNARLAT